MSIAISEILKQAAPLSTAEQLELAAKLVEQAQQSMEGTPVNGRHNETVFAEPLQNGTAESVPESEEEETEDEEWLDVSTLNYVPPKRTYMARARFYYVGRGKPMPYDLDDDPGADEEESEE